MLSEVKNPLERVFSWTEERFPFSRQDLDLSKDEAWEWYYDTVEEFDEQLGGVPFTVLKQILMMTWEGYGEQAFIDLLNEPTTSPRHIITFFEKEFRANEHHSPKSPFFSRKSEWPFIKAKRPCAFVAKDDFPFLIELVELERWAKRNPDILPERRTIYESEEGALRAGYEAALAGLKSENEKLKARVVELEKSAQEGAGDEEIGRLKMYLDEAERAREGLSSELAVKTLELEHVRQDLKDLEAVHGEGPKLRTMWRYVLELEARGMTDADIRNALKGDGFHNPAIDALLYPGTGANYSAVTKYFQRH